MHIIIKCNNVESHMTFPAFKDPIDEIYIITEAPWNMMEGHLTDEQVIELKEQYPGQNVGEYGLHFEKIKKE